jgi:membrane protein implicated in regulation of membrane protease activity
MREFFLIAFSFGLIMTLLTFAAGAIHQLPDLHGPDLHLPKGVPKALPKALPDGGAHHLDGPGAETPSPLTMPAILAFLMGMGGIGYLLLTEAAWPWWGALAGGSTVGVALGSVVHALFRALYRGQTVIEPGSDSLVGRPGLITSQIRLGGTGELQYVLHGVRQSIPARSESGQPIPKGTTVAVLRLERGIAYVEPLEAQPEE